MFKIKKFVGAYLNDKWFSVRQTTYTICQSPFQFTGFVVDRRHRTEMDILHIGETDSQSSLSAQAALFDC